MKWKEVDEARYTYMLEILPPVGWCVKGFLVGEAWTHKKCTVTHADGMPAFAPFVRFQGKFYEGDAPMTLHEFRALRPQDVLCAP